MTVLEELLSSALADPGNGWSIGTFGAIAEFRRNAGEPAECSQQGGWQQCVTARGAIGLRTQHYALPVAYETLSSDGESWGQTLAFCLPASKETSTGMILCTGTDQQPLQRSPGTALIFDLGVGNGHVTLSIRTAEPTLIDALRAMEGKALFGPDAAALRTLLVQTSPARIASSPLGRIEVYTAMPQPGGRGPSGPHTHLLPKLLAGGRPYSANTPIPPGLQPVLTLHPPSPWRDTKGTRIPFNAQADEYFRGLLERFGLDEDKATRIATEAAVIGGADPAKCAWPASRRARAQARIALRRLAQRLGTERLAPWKTLYDRGDPSKDSPDDPTTDADA